MGRTFPMCPLASMLCDTSTFCPVAIGLDDHKASVFGAWRQVAGAKVEDLKQFVLPSMRSHMTAVAGDLVYHPLFLLMSIAHHAGIYHPMMGYACHASMWHQVPPGMEAYIIHELSCLLDDVKHVKLGKVVDRRPGKCVFDIVTLCL
jgi:hypothetical protein